MNNSVPTNRRLGNNMDSDMKGYIVTGLLALCLLLGLAGQFGSTWQVKEEDFLGDGDVVIENSTGLRSKHIEMVCNEKNDAAVMACENINTVASAGVKDFDYMEYDDGVTTIELDGDYDACIRSMEDAGVTEDETCDDLSDVISAGTWGGIILWMGILSCLAWIVMFILPKFEFDLEVLPDNVDLGMSWAGGILTGLAVLAWYVLLPSGDASAGMSVWLTIIGSVAGVGAAAVSTFVADDES
jgi:hypothetical protein